MEIGLGQNEVDRGLLSTGGNGEGNEQ